MSQCKRGHERNAENTYFKPSGAVNACRICQKAAYSQRAQAQKAERLAAIAAAEYRAGEEWRPIAGVTKYEVSNLGRVRRSAVGWRSLTGKVRKPTLNSRGYLVTQIGDTYPLRTLLIHCAVAEAFLGPRPEGMQVDHKDGDKQNPRAENLEYVTGSENQRRAAKLRYERQQAPLF